MLQCNKFVDNAEEQQKNCFIGTDIILLAVCQVSIFSLCLEVFNQIQIKTFMRW